MVYNAAKILSSSALRIAANNLISHLCKDPNRAWHILSQTILSFGDQDGSKFYL